MKGLIGFGFWLGCLSLAYTSDRVERVFEKLSVGDGLSQASVQTLFQDSRGFLWLGTQDGLNRYDGYGFHIFKHRPEDPRTLSDNMIFDIAEDGSGHIWVATERGLNRYDPRTGDFRRYIREPGDASSLGHDRVYRLFVDSDQVLWIGTVGGGLNRYNAAADRFEHFLYNPAADNDDPSNRIWDMVEGRDGGLWLATNDGLWHFDRHSETFTNFPLPAAEAASPLSNVAWSLLAEADGRLLVGSCQDGLWYFDPHTFTYAPVARDRLGEHWIVFLHRDQHRRLWVGRSGAGVAVFDGDGLPAWEATQMDKHTVGFFENQVQAIGETRDGLIWLGTQTGVAKYDPRRERLGHLVFRPDDVSDLVGDTVLDFAESPDGRSVWIIGTSVVTRFHKERSRFEQLSGKVTAPMIASGLLSVAVDRRGVVWFGGRFEGLYRFDPSDGSLRHVQPQVQVGRPVRVVHDLVIDDGGQLWLATSGGGLVRFDPATEAFHPILSEGDVSPTTVMLTTLWIDGKRTVWVGTRSRGLWRHDIASGHWQQFPVQHHDRAGLNHPYVTQIYRDSRERLWVGTYGGGLSFLDETQGTFQPIHHGLDSGVVNGIVEDESGYLWVSTNNGLVRLAVRHRDFVNLLSVQKAQANAPALVRTFHDADGLQSREFNVGAVLRDEQGYLWFGGIAGLNRFLPHQLAPDHFEPLVTISELRVLALPHEVPQRFLDSPQALSLPARGQGVVAHFAVMDFRAPSRNRYAYRLQGYASEWTALGADRSLTLTGLPAGEYTLQVRGAGLSGRWQTMADPVTIHVRQPVWLSLWAKLLYVVVCLVVLGWLLVLHRRLVEARAAAAMENRLGDHRQERMESLGRLAGGIAHDFNNMLASMLGFNSLAMADLRKDEPIYQYLQEVDKAGLRAKELIRQILTFGKQGKPDMRPIAVAETVKEALALFRVSLPREVGLHTAIDTAVGWVLGDATQLHQVVLNLCTNAREAINQHDGDVKVSLAVRRDPDDPEQQWVVLTVADNGMGMDTETLDRIFEPFFSRKKSTQRVGMGLAVVHGIVSAMHGKIHVQSEPRQGSVFEVWLPRTPAPETQTIKATKLSIPPGRERCIWLVDDEGPLVTAWAAILRRNGYRVRVFTDPDVLLRVFHASPGAVDLVLTDWRMPHISGEELGRRLKKQRPELPIILCSGMTASGDWDDMSRVFDGALVKPFTTDELAALLLKCLFNADPAEQVMTEPSGCKVNQSPDDPSSPKSRYAES